ncbi:MAG: DUF4267 domain-containing protein [Actinomycetota bacterium]|nr:DUF4267 domain-containing protein [Actinomycetota bacterium]
MFRRKKKTDPLARQVALEIGATRVGLGIATFFATRPSLRALGFSESDATGRTFAKVLGGRDIAMGTLTLAVRHDPATLRAVVLASSLLDLADSVAFATAAANPETRRPGIIGVFSGGAAALAGLWAWRRLSDA